VISLAGTAIALGLALMPGWSPYTLFLPLVLNSFGNGMTIPSGTAEALSARPELAGSAAGLSGALQLGAGALASFVLSWTVTLWAPSLVLAMFLFNAAGLIALRRRARRS
jgi:DHA1 family bicyclomycin/chloramphenicol resistance-like MFS transporter